ncbi:MAG: hypothetical protein GF334_04485 [Candidatus Altiarchaeales archaeon]|nr:hypothetical protein [Candidatus Altiarchaeales archaeon]
MPIIESDPTAAEALREKYGGTWGKHPKFLSRDWAIEAAGDCTRQGYWDWVESQVWNAIDEVNAMKLEDLPEHLDDPELCPEAQDRVKERLEKGE